MNRFRDETGGVLVTVAVVLPLIVLLSAGGIVTFTLAATHRELQTAADQAALAGASALPPLYPNDIIAAVETVAPMPDTEPVYELSPFDLPRIGELVPDPRAVACAVGSAALDSDSAALVSTLEDQDLFEVPLGDDGEARDTFCTDQRVYPVIQRNPQATTPTECTNALVEQVATANLLPPTDTALDPLLGTLDPTISDIQATVNETVKLNLNNVLPAAFTPRMRVDVYSWIEPPLLRLVTNTGGGTMHTTATAYRRIKNAVVVPIVPSQRLLIETGVVDPVEVITDPVNVNLALNTSQQKLIEALDDADARLNDVMSTYGLPCENLLGNVRQDVRDVYDPPTGPAPSALDVVESAVTAAQNTASRTGIPEPDPNNPESLAGEAILLIGVTVDEFMNPVRATQIPILDAALVVMRKVADNDYRAATISAANAYGVFRATLVE